MHTCIQLSVCSGASGRGCQSTRQMWATPRHSLASECFVSEFVFEELASARRVQLCEFDSAEQAPTSLAALLGRGGDRLRVSNGALDVVRPPLFRPRHRPILTSQQAVARGAAAVAAVEEESVSPLAINAREMSITVLLLSYDGYASSCDGSCALDGLYDAAGVAGLLTRSSFGALRLQPRERTKVLPLRMDAARLDAATVALSEWSNATTARQRSTTGTGASDCAALLLRIAASADRLAFDTFGIDVTSVTYREYCMRLPHRRSGPNRKL